MMRPEIPACERCGFLKELADRCDCRFDEGKSFGEKGFDFELKENGLSIQRNAPQSLDV